MSPLFLGKKFALLSYAGRLAIAGRVSKALTALRDRPLGYEAMFWQGVAPRNCRVVVDVGAHIGSTTAAIDLALRPDRLVAVEPNPELTDGLRRRFAACAHIEVVPVALGEKAGLVDFYAHDFNAASSCFQAQPGYLHGLGFVEHARRIEVPCRRLEDVMREKDLNQVDLLKMDCQGSELSVLQGAGALLERTRCVVTEVMFDRVYDGGCVFGEVHAFLRERGFRLVRLERVTGPADALAQADAVYRR